MRVLRPDGASEIFTLKNGAWSADADVADIIIAQPGGNGYALQLAANRQTEIYDATGLLKEVYDPSGQRLLTLEYSTALTPAEIAPSPGLLVSVTDQRARSLRFTYDSKSRLSKMSLPDGGEHVFGYNAAGYLSSATAPDGTSKGYIYNERVNTSSADRPGFLTGITDEKGNRYETVKYLSSNRAYYTEFAGGVDATTLSYAALTSNGTLPVTVKSTLGAQSLLKFSDTGKGRTLPAGGSAACGSQCNQPYKSMTYDANGYPASKTDFKGNITRTTYSPDGLLTQQIDGAESPQQRTTITDWDTSLRVPLRKSVLNASGTVVASTNWTYNASGQETARCEVDSSSPGALAYACGSAANAPAGVRQTTTAYCSTRDEVRCPEIGMVLETDGPRTDVNDKVEYSYYLTADQSGCDVLGGPCHQSGDLHQVKNALGQVTTFLAYDRNGRSSRVRDVDGTIVDTAYTARGLPTSSTTRARTDGVPSQDDQAIVAEYDAAGNIASTIDQDGVRLNYQYDDAHRLVGIQDADGNSTTYTLDNAGNRVKEEVKDQAGVLKLAVSRTFNKLGQLTAVAKANGETTQHTFDLNGNVQTITDALKRKTQVDYDALDQLTRTIQDVGGLSVEMAFQLDALGRTTRVIDPKGMQTNYTYSGLGDLIGLTSPDSGSTSFTFDAAGNRKTATDARGVTTTYHYDAGNRLTRVEYPDPALDLVYGYDVAPSICAASETFSQGRLGRVQHAGGSTDYCHNRFGQITRKVQTVNGFSSTLRYTYSKSGGLATLTYPDGAVADYVRDALGRISQVGLTRPGKAREIVLADVTYAPFGPVNGWTYGNGRQLQRPLDLNYRQQAVHDASGDGLSLSYVYDEVGSIRELKDGTGSAVLAKYAYDTMGRLTRTQDGPTGAAIESYGYDASGNRTSLTTAAGTINYTYPATSHRVAKAGSETHTHDLAGNTTSIGGRTFSYSQAGRLSAFMGGSAVVERYGYNHRGERVVRDPVNGDTQITVYDEAGQWIGNYSESGQAQQQAIWLDGFPVALISQASAGVPELVYVEPDHLGTPRVVIDPARDVAIWEWSSKSEVFGNQRPASDPDRDGVEFAFGLRFPGQQATDASGLLYNYQRDLDPSSGRYLQSDPIGLNGGISTYTYVGANPLGGIDPLGLCELKIVCRSLPGVSVFVEAARSAYAANPAVPADRAWPFSVLRGSRVHRHFALTLKSVGGLYDAEVSYKNGSVVEYGTPGSVRADGVYGPTYMPMYVVELKSGAAGLSAAEIKNYYDNLPRGTKVCGLLEGVRP